MMIISAMTVFHVRTLTIFMYDRFDYIYVKKVYKKFIVVGYLVNFLHLFLSKSDRRHLKIV